MLARSTKGQRGRYGRRTQATDRLVDLVQADIIDPVKVSYRAVGNAASVACIRNSWGNASPAVSPGEVTRLRDSLAKRSD